MAPFRRGRSATPSSGVDDYDDDDVALNKERAAAWEARRRRKAAMQNGNKGSSATSRDLQRQKSASTRNNNNNNKKKPLPGEEYDPYDSDPGESYREHCERIKGDRTRSCLVMPRFLKDMNNNNNSSNGDKDVISRGLFGGKSNAAVSPNTVATEPPSPLTSEMDDMSPTANALFQHHYPNGLPASLPRDLARVRYSLRTSIGDGSERQPALAATHLMERRELRPNNIHINVSHWSDFGGRNYMEDRYVI